MRFRFLCLFATLATFTTSFADDSKSSFVEQLLSDDGNKTNNTDATDGKETIEEQYDGDNSISLTNGTDKSSSNPTSSVGPDAKTTTPKSKPRAPSFTVWSFFIGIFVAFLIIGLAVFALKFFCQRRTPGNNVPYTAYQ
ncbi:hypothetical protein L3Y34_015288 [Caenorhabditis briggsae]|uniref:Uncharacterized protein n=2 Tax=Caenorhabditis briggsae TaxID=6238 RepID=A0AAE9DU87_CAEBR|nr:hypothetical protein L3Y34_015288 [Caenorhabditis briggsae]